MSRERVLQNAPDWRSTVAEFLQHLIDHRRLSPRTVVAYGTDICQFAEWCDKAGVELTSETMDEDILLRYLGQLSGLATNSVRRKVHAISSWCEYLVRRQLLPANPARGLPLPKRDCVCSSPKTVTYVQFGAQSPSELFRSRVVSA